MMINLLPNLLLKLVLEALKKLNLDSFCLLQWEFNVFSVARILLVRSLLGRKLYN